MANKHNFALNNFDGPLDLLLYLIRDKKINIFDIDLLQLAQQYLDYIGKIEDQNLEIASEYLVMAATLIQIKSRALLEQPEDKEILQVDKNKLLQQLAEYHQFKKIKEKLREQELIRKRVFTKDPDDLSEFIRPEDPTQLDGNSDPVKLIMILRKMFERTYAQKQSTGIIDSFNISPEERADEIKLMFRHKNELEFEEIFSVPSIKHFLVTLIALLDLAREQKVVLKQEEQFGVIRILKGDEYE
jgi:segregation and condensation protein A